jgi:hypothetical protein
MISMLNYLNTLLRRHENHYCFYIIPFCFHEL